MKGRHGCGKRLSCLGDRTFRAEGRGFESLLPLHRFDRQFRSRSWPFPPEGEALCIQEHPNLQSQPPFRNEGLLVADQETSFGLGGARDISLTVLPALAETESDRGGEVPQRSL